MNKKFSTLLAGAALLSAVSANAQNPIKLVEGLNEGLYQLEYNGQVLSMTENSATGDDEFSMVTFNSSNIGSTMWCVTVSAEDQGQNPKFDFTNKIGKFLGLDINAVSGKALNAYTAVDAVPGAEIAGWAFSETFATGVVEAPLYSYFAPDSVVGLVVDGADIQMKKVRATDIATAGFTKFELKEASALIIANANDFNTVFGTQKADEGVKLTFEPDVLGDNVVNPFNAKDIMVEASNTAKWFYVLNTDSSYLYVDTAYTNTVGVSKFLGYNWADLKAAKLPAGMTAKDSIESTNNLLSNQYKFQFVYWPSQDSLEIKVYEARFKQDADATWAGVTATRNTAVDAVNGEKLNVSLQELLTDQVRILTVAEKQNTKISFGFGGCAPVKSNKTTVADGVYFIKNKEGKYLSVPIYQGTYATANASWVTLEEVQNANDMPAYQWVVLKKNTTDPQNISPINVYNREFDSVSMTSVQLRQEEDSQYMFAENSMLVAGDSLIFEPVAATYYTNEYLGYKALSDDELLTNKYTFEYWHPYATEGRFIAQSESDSTLNVIGDGDAFKLTKVGEYTYGYKVTVAVKKRIANLAQLKRQAYLITKGDANYQYNTELKYAVSEHYANNDTVYFKENNCVNGIHYYAIIEGASKGLFAQLNSAGNAYVLGGKKAGVSDLDPNATLRAQVYSENRTSAFAIAPDNTPLYRHFNNAALGENIDDSTDSLVFVEKTRGEYLMDEWNENLRDEEVCYAGIWNAEKANGHLAFNIDTAWVNRGSGLVKPQYLISVARNDQSSIETIPCTEDGPHVRPDGTITTDPSECVHAIHGREGFIYGKFLVSFADSVANLTNKDGQYNPPYMDVKDGYTRVGFVPAIKVGDSLVILTDEFKKVAPEKLDTATIFASYRANKQENFIVDLTGDNHKNVTWSFRYVNPDQAGNVAEEGEANEFLFESNIYTKDGEAADATNNVATGKGKAALGYDEVVAGSIAPAYAAWLKMQNGCLVLTDATSSFGNAKTGGDGALIFNAYQKAADQDMVTDNEEIAVEEGVSVIAGNGQVTIQGAAGKTVVITNILGKAVANTVLTSDNQTINVPAGIVAVAVEGEEAVKAIVR